MLNCALPPTVERGPVGEACDLEREEERERGGEIRGNSTSFFGGLFNNAVTI
jgi:hypothetical protein